MRKYCISLLILVLTGSALFSSAQRDETCTGSGYDNLSEAVQLKDSDSFAFQFPLDEPRLYRGMLMTRFSVSRTNSRGTFYHCAEDYYGDPGLPVYAMTDGKVVYSGRMGGYGWLVIVNHPDLNLYSLYGHLSPSRWSIRRGDEVAKGSLLGYLGDEYENGGSRKDPLVPHLHFGIRVGQMFEYPGKGDWRWMAGWIKVCPVSTGWLEPSSVIMNQGVPIDETAKPTGYLAGWWMDALFAFVYLFGGAIMSVFAWRYRKLRLLSIYGLLLVGVGLFFLRKQVVIGLVLLAVAAVFLLTGGWHLVALLRRRREARYSRGNDQL